jgi:Transposase DDE domain
MLQAVAHAIHFKRILNFGEGQGYEVSQRKRKRVEQSFGWMKMVGMLKKVKLRGIDKVGWLFTFTGAAYNRCRLRNLMAEA